MFELNSTISKSSRVDEGDVKNTKSILRDLGFYPNDKPIEGFTDNELFDGIKDFQKIAGVKVDGVMRPKGETESRINQVMNIFEKSKIQKTAVRTPDFNANAKRHEHILLEKKPKTPSRHMFDKVKPEQKPFDENDNDIREKILKKDIPATFKIQKYTEPDDFSFESLYRQGKEYAIQKFVKDPHIGNKAVHDNNNSIEKISKKHGVDPDLTRAVIWAENARGHKFGLDELADDLEISKTQLPMNINGKIWSSLIGKKSKSLNNLDDNIEAGVILLKRIQERIDNPTAAKIGSIWNYNGRENTSFMGEEIGKAYKEKPWKTIMVKPQQKPKK